MNLIIKNHLIETEIIDILKQIKSELHGSKLKIIEPKGSEIRVTCPHHKDGREDTPSCQIYVGTDIAKYGHFNCFTCGEHGEFVHFVALCFDETDSFAEEWLLERYGNTLIETHYIAPPIEDNKQVNTFIDESILDSFQSYHPYMDVRKLSKKVCETFQVKYDTHTKCLVFPVRDDRGRLWMLTRRSVESKKFIIDKDKEKPTYLLYYIKKNNIDEVLLCESQINALYGWSMGYPSIATFGCNITDRQIEEINKSGIKHLYICYDGDFAGRKGTRKVINNISKSIFVDVIIMPDGKDLNDLTEDEFKSLQIINSNDWLIKESEHE